jgi:hypothetical protein
MVFSGNSLILRLYCAGLSVLVLLERRKMIDVAPKSMFMWVRHILTVLNRYAQYNDSIYTSYADLYAKSEEVEGYWKATDSQVSMDFGLY